MNNALDAPQLAGKRILMVEDREENVRLFRAILSLEQAHVLVATTAHQGIEMAIQEKPDLILMDLQMPDMDGFEATQKLCDHAGTKEIPVVMLTASAMPEDRQRALDCGCKGYISKPVDPITLVQQLEAVLAVS